MNKTLLCTLLACTLAAGSAVAGTHKLPDDDSAFASVEIPDAWKPEAIDKGVQANSPDSEIYVALEGVTTDKGVEADVDETEKMLLEHKVIVDTASKTKSTFKIGDLEATEFDFKAKMEGVDQTVAIVLIPIKGKMVIMTYWATAAKEKAHSAEIGQIAKSIKAL